MQARIEFLEKTAYASQEAQAIHWSQDKLEEYFPGQVITEITDHDFSSSNQYLVALDNPGYFADDLDQFMERADAYYLEVHISSIKPLVHVSFWKYPKGTQGQELLVTAEAPLAQYEQYLALAHQYAADHQLALVSKQDFNLQLEEEGRQVSLYYKYFNFYPDDDPWYSH